jgi:hypothetical protein
MCDIIPAIPDSIAWPIGKCVTRVAVAELSGTFVETSWNPSR